MNATEEDLKPGARVEWKDSNTVGTGTLVRPDDGIGGPWWLVDTDMPDGTTTQYLVKTYVLYPPGGLRRERLADEIRMTLWRACSDFPPQYVPSWEACLAVADAVLALDEGGLR